MMESTKVLRNFVLGRTHSHMREWESMRTQLCWECVGIGYRYIYISSTSRKEIERKKSWDQMVSHLISSPQFPTFLNTNRAKKHYFLCIFFHFIYSKFFYFFFLLDKCFSLYEIFPVYYIENLKNIFHFGIKNDKAFLGWGTWWW